MPALYTVQVRTHPGSVREINEDSISTVLDWRAALDLGDEDLNEKGHLFAVADGMGGHAAGEVASKLAIEILYRTYYDAVQSGQGALADSIAAANEALTDRAESEPDQAGMGTTLVGGLLKADSLLVFNVGDSRAYLFRDGNLSQVTRDHSWVAQQIDAGVLTLDEAARHPYRNVITHSLGPDRDAQADFIDLRLQPHDILLLCSDGLSNMATGEEMAALLRAYPLDQAAQLLLELALERGAPDNVSFELIEYLGDGARVRRQRWPWLALIVTIILLVVLTLARPLRNVLFQVELASTESPLPTPTVLAPEDITIAPPEAPPTVADPIRVGGILLDARESDPQNGACGLTGGEVGQVIKAYPLDTCYLFFVEGEIASIEQSSRGWELRLGFVDRSGEPYSYNAILTSPWLPGVTPPQAGDRIALLARPVHEEYSGGDVAVEPLAILDASSPMQPGAVLWMSENESLPPGETQLWTYTAFGAGGSDALRIPTPPGLAGIPIALWGKWRMPDTATGFTEFTPLQSPYEWQETERLYRQADN
ncbi:MAG: protein phosphatase 2C domain-containing protein [Caldilineales bacterium]|nr:protein phosphatase 2C domain-containing protein [Caldilineales bacterium]